MGSVLTGGARLERYPVRMTYRLVLTIQDFEDTKDLIVVSDDPDEVLWDAMMRALAKRSGQERVARFAGGGWANGGWHWTDPNDPAYFGLIWAGGDLTVGQMATFLGDEAEHNTLELGWGWGGEVEPALQTIIDLVGDASLAYGAIAFMRGKVRQAIDGERAGLMAHYRDSGDLTMELRQQVMALREWRQDDFLRKFQTDPATAAKVMAELNYEVETRGGKRYWIEAWTQEQGCG